MVLSSVLRGVRGDARIEIERMIASDDFSGLFKKTGALHGHYCIGSSLGIMASLCALKELGLNKVGEREKVYAIVETNSCFIDGVQVVTGCTLGNKSLTYRDYGKTALTLLKSDGKRIRISRKPESNEALSNKNPEFVRIYARAHLLALLCTLFFLYNPRRPYR